MTCARCRGPVANWPTYLAAARVSVLCARCATGAPELDEAVIQDTRREMAVKLSISRQITTRGSGVANGA